MTGLVPPDSGQVRILGMDWRDRGTAIRTRIGVQFQSTELDDKVKVREALEMFGSFYPRARRPSSCACCISRIRPRLISCA
jgi:ABC-2 type transport system ATP-binding protein